MAGEAPEKLLWSVCDVCRALNISRSSFFSLQASGRIGPIPARLNRKVLFVRSEIESWLLAKDPKTGLLPNREKWQLIKGTQDA